MHKLDIDSQDGESAAQMDVGQVDPARGARVFHTLAALLNMVNADPMVGDEG